MLTRRIGLRSFSSLYVPEANSAVVLVSESNDINLNLATEEFLYEHSEVPNPVMFLWRNTDCIIYGKHQNPWKECLVQKIQEDGVGLARRKSGGGCVYQDMGNSVFSFFSPITDFAETNYKTLNNEILIDALASLGIQGEASGRNDLTVDGRKVSGSAYKLNLGRKDGSHRKSLHHGTMLLDANLSAMKGYLNPSKPKLESKGVDSVVSRVMNLSEKVPDITNEMWWGALEKAFENYHYPRHIQKQTLSVDEVLAVPKIKETYEQMLEWDWRFGKSPKFTNSIEAKLSWAMVDINFEVEKGQIVSGKVWSDALVPDLIDLINEKLYNKTYDVKGIRELCKSVKEEPGHFKHTEETKAHIDEFEEWLVNAI